MLLKSMYISIFGFVHLLFPLETLMPQRFQGFLKGAHLIFTWWILSAAILPKMLISLCLGAFGSLAAEMVVLRPLNRLAGICEAHESTVLP